MCTHKYVYKCKYFCIFSWRVYVEGYPEDDFCVTLRNIEHSKQIDFSLAILVCWTSRLSLPFSPPLPFFVYQIYIFFFSPSHSEQILLQHTQPVCTGVFRMGFNRHVSNGINLLPLAWLQKAEFPHFSSFPLSFPPSTVLFKACSMARIFHPGKRASHLLKLISSPRWSGESPRSAARGSSYPSNPVRGNKKWDTGHENSGFASTMIPGTGKPCCKSIFVLVLSLLIHQDVRSHIMKQMWWSDNSFCCCCLSQTSGIDTYCHRCNCASRAFLLEPQMNLRLSHNCSYSEKGIESQFSTSCCKWVMRIAALRGKTGNPGAQRRSGHVDKMVIDKQELPQGLCWRRRTWLSGWMFTGAGVGSSD